MMNFCHKKKKKIENESMIYTHSEKTFFEQFHFKVSQLLYSPGNVQEKQSNCLLTY